MRKEVLQKTEWLAFSLLFLLITGVATLILPLLETTSYDVTLPLVRSHIEAFLYGGSFALIVVGIAFGRHYVNTAHEIKVREGLHQPRAPAREDRTFGWLCEQAREFFRLPSIRNGSSAEYYAHPLVMLGFGGILSLGLLAVDPAIAGGVMIIVCGVVGLLFFVTAMAQRTKEDDFNERVNQALATVAPESDNPAAPEWAARAALKVITLSAHSAGRNLQELQAAMWQAQQISGHWLQSEEIQDTVRGDKPTGSLQELCDAIRGGFHGIQRQAVVQACAEVMCADGVVPEAQMEWLLEITGYLGLDSFTGRTLINRARTAYRKRQREAREKYFNENAEAKWREHSRKRHARSHTTASDTVAAYVTLGLEHGASDSDIKRAYHTAAMKYHPDRLATASEDERLAAEYRFKEIVAAYETLTG